MLPVEDRLHYAGVMKADQDHMEKKGFAGGALGFDFIEE